MVQVSHTHNRILFIDTILLLYEALHYICTYIFFHTCICIYSQFIHMEMGCCEPIRLYIYKYILLFFFFDPRTITRQNKNDSMCVWEWDINIDSWKQTKNTITTYFMLVELFWYSKRYNSIV